MSAVDLARRNIELSQEVDRLNEHIERLESDVKLRSNQLQEYIKRLKSAVEFRSNQFEQLEEYKFYILNEEDFTGPYEKKDDADFMAECFSDDEDVIVVEIHRRFRKKEVEPEDYGVEPGIDFPATLGPRRW